jgi:hypothetical protein
LSAQNEQGLQRLFDPDDFVRIELEMAFEKGIRTIPVLVNGARMPQAEELPSSLRQIATLNCEELLHHRFGTDVRALTSKLITIVPPIPDRWKRLRWYAAIFSLALLVAVVIGGLAKSMLEAPERLDDGRRQLARSTAEIAQWSRPDSAVYNWLLNVFSIQMAQSKEHYQYGSEPYQILPAQVDDRSTKDDGYLVWWPGFCAPSGGCRYDVLRFGDTTVLGSFNAENIRTTKAFLNGRTIFLDNDGQFIVWTGERYEKQK